MEIKIRLLQMQECLVPFYSHTRYKFHNHADIYNSGIFNKATLRTYLVVQWLRLHASTAGGLCSTSGQGIKILQNKTNK